MAAPLVLSRGRLLAFMLSPRLFQERYLLRLPHPAPPLPPEAEEAARRGQLFHRLLAQHFAGVPDLVPPEDEAVQRWWAAFREQGPRLPAGRRLPEISLTVPVGAHFVTGRFDLLVADPPHLLHIFDWKTERRPRTRDELAADWQTRLYLALAAAGGQAVVDGGDPFAPPNVRLTYWFASAPHAPVSLGYDAAAHETAWAQLAAVVEAIDELLRADPPRWPETSPWSPEAGSETEVEDAVADDVEPAWS